MPYQPFNPAQCLRTHCSDQPEKTRAFGDRLPLMTLEELREANRHWFNEPQSDLTVARLWQIAVEFNRRRIAPRWRGIEGFNPSAVPKYREDQWRLPGLMPLGDAMKRKLLLRWVDLEWLLLELGPAHFPDHRGWRDLFRHDVGLEVKEALFSAVANSQEKPNRIVELLRVPAIYRLAIRGFATSAAGDRCRIADRRVKAMAPHIGALAQRRAYPLNDDQISARIDYAHAIELAQGSPTDAVQLLRWQTGRTVTRQSVHEMRRKMALELGLIRQAWQ